MSRWIRNIAVTGLIGVFLMPIIGYAVSLVRGGDRVSATEKRVLAEMPSLQGDARQFTTDFDQYLNDNFGFRMLMIRVARKIRDNLGENPPSVIVGKDGWLFLGQLDYRDEFEGNGPWDNEDVQRWVESLSEVKASLARRGIPFAAFVAVDKARAYPEKLPDDWEEGDRRFRTELYSHPKAGTTGLVDAEPLVLQAKARGKQTFFLRDTHWTSDGTYDLAMEVMDTLDPDIVRPRYLPGPPQEWPPSRLLDLEAMAGFEKSQEPVHLMIDFPRTWVGFMERISKLPDGSVDPGQFSTIKIQGSRDAPAGRLVIVGDSFADAMVGHFRPSYAEIIRIHHGAHFSTVSLEDVMAYEPDAVLFATAERQAMIKERPFAPLDAAVSEP